MLDNLSKQILIFARANFIKGERLSVREIHNNIPDSNINYIKLSLEYLRINGYLEILTHPIHGPVAITDLTHKGIIFEEFEKANTISSQTFNINSVNNSAFGNNGDITINNTNDLEEIRLLIASKPLEDQQELTELVDELQTILESNQPIKRGMLAKFSDALAKHSNIVVALAPHIFNWLTKK